MRSLFILSLAILLFSPALKANNELPQEYGRSLTLQRSSLPSLPDVDQVFPHGGGVQGHVEEDDISEEEAAFAALKAQEEGIARHRAGAIAIAFILTNIMQFLTGLTYLF